MDGPSAHAGQKLKKAVEVYEAVHTPEKVHPKDRGAPMPACGRDQASLASAVPCPSSVSPCQRSSDGFDVAVRRFDRVVGKPRPTRETMKAGWFILSEDRSCRLKGGP